MTLPILPASAIEELARACRITDHRTGSTTSWSPNIEQITGWRRAEEAQREHRWLMIAKPRQVGNTTARTLDLVAWAAVADAEGHRVRAAIVVDTDDKTRERAAVARSFVEQLSLGGTCNTERITFPGGSIVDFVTARGQRVGASGSYQRLLLSELPFWPAHVDTYGSLMATLSLDGFCEIDTTIDIAAPSGDLARTLWRTPNRYEKLFFPVELHEEYRAAASLITDDEWVQLQGEGFTHREAAAWWLAVAVRDMAAGDVTRAMREFPQRAEHMFQASSARWVSVTPRVLSPTSTIATAGSVLEVFKPLASTSGQLAIGVDTAAGKERDRSAIAVIDKRDTSLCACLVDDKIRTHALAQAVLATANLYTTPRVVGIADETRAVRPDVVIEANGIGQGTIDAARALGLDCMSINTDEAGKYDGLLRAKAAIEAGKLYGPAQLAEECDSLHRDHRGAWKGRKDLLMAIGFALRHMQIAPYTAPDVALPDPHRVDGLAIVRRRLGHGRTW